MAVSIKSLGLDRLGFEERLSLVEELWDSIAADGEAVLLMGPQRVELDRRLADHETDPSDVMSWDEVRSSVSDQLKR
jgi:putative addiction module component (TIGR02574 family)